MDVFWIKFVWDHGICKKFVLMVLFEYAMTWIRDTTVNLSYKYRQRQAFLLLLVFDLYTCFYIARYLD